MEYALMVNTKDCVGCSACEVACKQEHNLPVGLGRIRVYPDGPRQIEGKLQLRYTVAHCMHCRQPACQEVCPAQAITKRDDGIILIDEKRCNGCQCCIEGCPLGVMQFNKDAKVAQKCDLCVSRLDKGVPPACVSACPSHCIYFGDAREVIEKLRDSELLARYKTVSG